MTEKSRVLSGSVASSLVGVEHAFFLVPPAALSGVALTPLVTEAPGLTALGPRGLAFRRGWESEIPGLAFRRVEGSTRGLTAWNM